MNLKQQQLVSFIEQLTQAELDEAVDFCIDRGILFFAELQYPVNEDELDGWEESTFVEQYENAQFAGDIDY